jgi:Tol biopolymer transport system component
MYPSKSRVTRIAFVATLALISPVLVSCGGGGVDGGLGGGGGNNAADFVASFEGFDSTNRRLSLTMTPTAASMGQVNGTFDSGVSNMSIYDPGAPNPSVAIAVSGSFNGQAFTITLASASNPLGTSYSGSFTDQHTVEIRPTTGTGSITLRRNGYFFPALLGNWTGTAGGQPWLMQLGFAAGYDGSDSSSRVVGTELRDGRTSRVTGFLTVRHVRLIVERGGGTVTIDGEFPLNGTTVNADSINFGAQGSLTRGGLPDAARVLYLHNFEGAVASVDLFGNQRTDVVPTPTTSRIYELRVSPDKTHAAYWRQEAMGTDLWLVRLSDRVTRRVTLQGDSGITQWMGAQWSPGGTHLAYAMRTGTSGPFNTFVVRTDGSDPVPLTSNVAATTVYSDPILAWAPGTTGAPLLAFTAAESPMGDITHLYLQRMDGSGRVQITPSLVSGQHVRAMSWSPDGQRLAFTGNTRVVNARELFVATSAGAVSQILPQLPGDRLVSAIGWSPDSQRLAFVANTFGSSSQDLRVVARDSTSSQLISDLAGGPFTNQSIWEFGWAPDGTRLGYSATYNNQAMHMYAATADGAGSPIMLSDATSLGANNSAVRWNSSGTHLAFTVQANAQSQSLVSASADGASRTALADQLALGCYVDFAWSPNGNYVAFVRDLPSGECGLFAVEASGSNAHALEAPSHESAFVNGFTWWPDSMRIVYLSNRDNSFGRPELFVAYANGNAALKLSGNLDETTEAQWFQPL